MVLATNTSKDVVRELFLPLWVQVQNKTDKLLSVADYFKSLQIISGRGEKENEILPEREK